MDTAGTPPLSSSDLKARLGAAAIGPTDIFGLAYIQLCGLAYEVDPADVPAAVADRAQVTPWGGGDWRCVWGPALDAEEANLVYVAAYYEAELPVAAVVSVRGTDVTDDVWGDLKEAFEDLAASSQVPLPWHPDHQVRVADGTLDALTTIERMRPPALRPGEGVPLRRFLERFLGDPANARPALVVTGHSLGGCVATVLAPWLRHSLARVGIDVPIVPCTFAAPSAGNEGFTRYFAGLFPYAPRYTNNLDVVPLAWESLAAINSVYDSEGLATPLVVQWLVDMFRAALWEKGAHYVQPGRASELQGSFCMELDWYQQIGAQHDHNNYIRLMNGEQPTCPAVSRARNRHWSPEEKAAALSGGAAA